MRSPVPRPEAQATLNLAFFFSTSTPQTASTEPRSQKGFSSKVLFPSSQLSPWMTTPQSFRYVVNLAMLLPEICNVFFCTFLYLKALFFFPQPFHFYISVWCTENAQRYALSLCLPLSFWHFPTTFISWQRIIHTFPTIEKPPYFSPMHNPVGGWICPPPLPPNVLHRNLRLFE